VDDSVTDGPATMQIAAYGEAYFGGLAVDGSESPELADASEATWATATHSYTHTPTETPRAILIAVVGVGAGSQTITYGGEPVPRVGATGSPSYYYLAAPPTGAQTVAFSAESAASCYAVVMTIAGDRPVTIGSTDGAGGAGFPAPPTTVHLGA